MTGHDSTDSKIQPLVVIIILTCNQKDMTLQCLASFEKCTYGNKKIVLVDNGSSDNVLDAVQASFPEIVCLRNEQNMGAAAGRNIGIDYALFHWDFEYILFIDNDTMITPGFLVELVFSLVEIKDEKVEIASPKVYVMGENQIIDSAGGAKVNFFTASTQNRGFGEVDTGQYDRDNFPKCVPSTVCVLMQREALERAGHFDISFDPYGYEDLDMMLRGCPSSGKFLFVPQSIIFHKGSKTGFVEYTSEYTRVKGKNLRRFFARHATGFQQFCFFLLLPFLVFRTFARELCRGNVGAIMGLIKGYLSHRE